MSISKSAAQDPLLQPYQLKHLTLKNRVIITSHEPAYAEDGMPKERYIAYHTERAKAGVAMTMTAGSAAVSKDSPPVFNNLLAYKDEIVPWLQRLTDSCHEHGAAVMIQMTHLGRRTRSDKGDWLPAVSASYRREPAHRGFPKMAEDWDRERIKKDYADAAERMKAGGLDGLELQAYGHLMDQFWSPRTNTLEDAYGGSLDNRLRFFFELLNAMRERVGPDFIIGVRYTADETATDGIDETEGLEISKRMRDSGLVDFLNVIRGRIETDAAMTRVIPVQGMKSAPHLDFAGRVRAATGMPVFHAARIPDVATARHAIAEGLLDLVGMTRAHMADPHLVRKIIEGREDAIRPCVGANHCLDRIYQAGDALCIHNAATGRELTMPHDIPPAPEKKKVVIVGAGPSGAEAARVAADRGHDVIVFEAAPEAGGQLRLAAEITRRREMRSIIEWRLARCEEKGVVFHYNTYAEAADILAQSPDIVLIATGGLPDTEIPGPAADQAVSTWDILSGDVKIAERVVLYDDAGDYPAMHAAEKIVEAGAELEIITPDRSLFPEVMAMSLTPGMKVILQGDPKMTLGREIVSLSKSGNQLALALGGDYEAQPQARISDQVVVNRGTQPLDDLYFELRPRSSNLGAVDYDALIEGRPQTRRDNPAGAFQLFRIGDAVSARGCHAAIFDALRLVKDL